MAERNKQILWYALTFVLTWVAAMLVQMLVDLEFEILRASIVAVGVVAMRYVIIRNRQNK